MDKQRERDLQKLVAFEEFSAFDETEPEKNLLKAVLLSALDDLAEPGAESLRATKFFTSQEDDYLFSFRSICSFLNVDPDKVLYVAGVRNQEDKTAKTKKES